LAVGVILQHQPQQVFREWPDAQSTRRGATALSRIQDSGLLRVCYRGSDYPSAFFNSNGDLVGFDIELAHRFARHLEARIEFLPVQSARDAWLQNARSAGIVDRLYRFWMLGEIDETRPPRWSIARDVLGWLD
jgi:ABC-type amino acid transport substrate-binding protein